MTEQDEWAIGLIFGLCRVQSLYGNYPVACAPFIRLALKVIKAHHLDVHPNAVEFARRWLKEVERQPTRIEKLLVELEETRLNSAQRVRVRRLALKRSVNTCKQPNQKGRSRRTSPDAKFQVGEQVFARK